MEDSPTRDSRRRLANYLYDLASWRYDRTQQHGDEVDQRRIEGLRSLARHVNQLDDDDERLYTLAALDTDPDRVFQPGSEADQLARHYLDDLRNESPDAWLTRFVDALARDRGHDLDGPPDPQDVPPPHPA